MAKLLVTIEIQVEADQDGDDEVKDAVFDKLNELMESDELEFNTEEIEEDNED